MPEVESPHMRGKNPHITGCKSLCEVENPQTLKKKQSVDDTDKK